MRLIRAQTKRRALLPAAPMRRALLVGLDTKTMFPHILKVSQLPLQATLIKRLLASPEMAKGLDGAASWEPFTIARRWPRTRIKLAVLLEVRLRLALWEIFRRMRTIFITAMALSKLKTMFLPLPWRPLLVNAKMNLRTRTTPRSVCRRIRELG